MRNSRVKALRSVIKSTGVNPKERSYVEINVEHKEITHPSLLTTEGKPMVIGHYRTATKVLATDCGRYTLQKYKKLQKIK